MPLSLSLSTSLNKTQDTTLNSITKTSLATVFGSNTNLGTFQATPTLETILTRAKSLIPEFHNENKNWYEINISSNTCQLEAKTNNFYYDGSVTFSFAVGGKTSLQTLVDQSELTDDYAGDKYWAYGDTSEKTDQELIDEAYETFLPSILNKNQIISTIIWDTSYNGTVSTTSGIIHFEPASGSTIYSSGFVDINFNNGLASPNNMTNNVSPSPYIASASNEWDGNHRASNLWTDNKLASSLCWAARGTSGNWNQIYLGGKDFVPTSFKLQARIGFTTAHTQAFRNLNIVGSNDGTIWESIINLDNISQWGDSEIREWTVQTTTSYKYFRFIGNTDQYAASGATGMSSQWIFGYEV